LYWRIWLAVLASIALFALLVAGAWKLFAERPYNTQQRVFAELAAGVLPGPGAPAADVRASLEHWKLRLDSDLALFAADGTPMGATSDTMPPPPLHRPEDSWVGSARGPAFSMQLPDGRFLLARHLRVSSRAPFGLIGMLALIARIEQLVSAHRLLLANASHELRSPLARVRMAVEMLQSAAQDSPQAARLRRELRRDIEELDALIDEILVASRLEATDPRAGFADVDLAALCAEECARGDICFEAEAQIALADPFALHGDPRLLRRALRNLVDNAQRHGGATPIEVALLREPAGLVLTVCDRGPGVPPAERERIFEPFYRPAGAPEPAGGVGLGLALVRKIARQHDGQVICRPREGGGSCFELRLPLER
jgi:signal transduction histidine kinase